MSEAAPDRNPRILSLVVLAAVLLAAFVLTVQFGRALVQAGGGPPGKGSPAAAASGKGEKVAPGWKGVEQLIGEQKFEKALEAVGKIREAARAAGDEEEWTRALVKEVQLRMGLHGYETAVRFLKEQPWPKGEAGRDVLDLFYAHSLLTYYRAYSWEIVRREKVESKGVDLKAWTKDELFAEAQRAMLEVWARREALGREKVVRLKEYLQPNDYPEGVRDTLRDAVAYLLTELLADTSFWTPKQSNQVYALDLPGLLKGPSGWWERGAGGEPVLSDPAAHPLVKIAAVLSDLEGWHTFRGEREAALEARLARLRHFHGSFTRSEDRALIRKDLEERLPGFRAVPWFSMGKAELAEMVRQEPADEAPDALVQARAVALEGLRAYPDSPGGRRCDYIAQSIEAPEYDLSSMKSDAPSRRSLLVTHRNLQALAFRAYPVDLVRRVESARDYNLLPRWDEVRELLKSARPAAEWRAELPATPDYRTHRTFVTPPALKPGLYLVAASAKPGFPDARNRIQAVGIVVGDLVLLARDDGEGGQEVQAVSGATGRPVAGADVMLYRWDWQRGHQRTETKRTGDDGAVRFTRPGGEGGSFFFLARKGEEVALDEDYRGFYTPQKPAERTASLVYTDRSIYRPGQKLYWKVLAYRGRGDLGRFQALSGAAVSVSLCDLNNQKVADATVTTNGYGTASGEFQIPPGRPLGAWRVVSSLNGAAGVRVEEYKRPTFETAFKDPAAPLRLNRPATLAGEARYYFGLPVVNGSVVWRATRRPVYPWWWGWYGWGGDTSPQTVGTGTAKLKEDGTFEVTFTPSADEREASSPGMSYRYEVSADVTDEGGETRTATRGFRLGFVSVEARLDSEEAFLTEGGGGTFTVHRTDLNGTPKAGAGSWRLTALAQPDKTLLPADLPVPAPPAPKGGAEPYRTPGDALRPRWDAGYTPDAVLRTWKDGTEKGRGTVACNEKGEGRVTLPALAPGAYRLAYETKDDFGAPCTASKEFVVAAARTPLALPALLLVQRGSVPVGGMARFFVHSGLAGQPLLFELYRDGRLLERRRLETGRSDALIEIPVAEKDRGGFGARLTLVRDHQVVSFAESVYVPWDDKQLQVEFSTFRDKLRPGGTETWRVAVKAPGGKSAEAGAAELLAYMYDKSLDLFAPHTPPNPAGLYPSHTGTGSYGTSLGQASTCYSETWGWNDLPSYPVFRGDELRFYDGYGIGGPGQRGYPMSGMDAMAEGRTRAAAPAPPASAPAKAMKDEAAAPREQEADKKGKAGSLEEPKVAAADGGGEAQPIRSNFAETAFWQPHLLTDKEGSAIVEFTVPDSVTAWNVWVHAVTRDLRAGSVHKETRSVKDLMVRPYVPRFFREGDRADLKVVVNNASDRDLSGAVSLEVFDPDTNENLAPAFGLPASVPPQSFTVKPGGGANVTFALAAPPRVGMVAFKVVAKAGDLSDGELRPLPVLPGRMHLAQSRFVTLKDADRRELVFEEMAKGGDPSLIHEKLVVTVDGQLFYGILQALPYLVNYPYECTEQTLNRFLSTGILTSLYRDYPAVARMAQEFSKRETPYEAFDDNDPNRKMALEETPWLEDARGGKDAGYGMVKVLDPRIATAQRDASLAKLLKSQTSLGGFPWWAGGPPSPYMTLYIVYGFSKGLEFGVELPKEPVVKAFSYLHRHYLDECVKEMMADDVGWEFVTFLNYTLSNFPDESWSGGVFTAAERKQMLDFSFKHWKDHSPYLKGYLTLTLKRAGRSADAKLVWDSVMDSAKTTRDEGTSWAPEDRGWLWYNDTIETHAFALRTLMELSPKDSRTDGLVQWIFLNKKLNHWESTRATAEVLYSVAHYLRATGALGVKESVSVAAGSVQTTFAFDPDVYTGRKNQVVVPGEKVDPRTMSTVVVTKEGKGFAFASATWHFSTEKLPEKGSGDLFAVERAYFRRVKTGDQITLQPLADGAPLAVGDELEVQLSLRARHAAEYVHLRDPRPAGCEPVAVTSGYKWDLGLARYEEVRDSGTNFFMEWVPQGQYTLKYRLRCAMAGTFRVNPATLQSMYAPEFNAYSAGNVVVIQGL